MSLCKSSFIATTLCLMAFNAPAFSQTTDTSGQNTATTEVNPSGAADPSMDTNTGATADTTSGATSSDTMMGSTRDAGDARMGSSDAARSGAASGESGAMDNSAAMSGTTDTATGSAGTTTDTSVMGTTDPAARDSARTDLANDPYLQAEESTGRSPFFYILLALIAFALIGYAVKASKRSSHNVRHTSGRA